MDFTVVGFTDVRSAGKDLGAEVIFVFFNNFKEVILSGKDTGFDLFLPSYSFNISFLRAFHCSYLCLRASFSADGVCIDEDLLRFDFLGGELLLLLDIFNDLILDFPESAIVIMLKMILIYNIHLNLS